MLYQEYLPRSRDVAQLVEYLPSTHKAQQTPALHKTDMLARTFNSKTWVMEAGGSGIQDHPWLKQWHGSG